MATVSDRLEYNIAGRFYVDSSCIDCDQCRVIAPNYFSRNEETGTSYVSRQPESEDGIAECKEAIDSCATSSIGDDGF